MPPKTSRTVIQRTKRLIQHPIQTVRDARTNRQNKEWEIYYEAAKRIGSSENNAREFANQLSGKAIIRSRLQRVVKPTLEPYAELIRKRHALKEKLLKWQAEHDRLDVQINGLDDTRVRRRRHVSEREIGKMIERGERLADKIHGAQAGLTRIGVRLKKLY